MSIEWSKSLSTGVKWQDRQHKELFKRISSLVDAMNVGLGKDEVQRLLRFLEEYFVVHFEAEEQAMNRLNYPGTLPHLAEHTRFIEEMGRLKAEAAATGVTTKLVIQVQSRVMDWLINHIGSVDKNLGAFILKADGEEAGDKKGAGRTGAGHGG